MSCNSTPSANNTFSPTNIHTTAPANVVLRWMQKQTRIPHSARKYVLAYGIRMTLHATSGRFLKICVSGNDKQRTCDEKIAKPAQIASNRHRTQNLANARFLYFVCSKIS